MQLSKKGADYLKKCNRTVCDLNRFNNDPKSFYEFANQILKTMGLQ